MSIESEGVMKEHRLALLKNRLLLRLLDETVNTNLHEAIILEAGVSAALARMTHYPLLLFPCLFEERIRTAVQFGRPLFTRLRQESPSGTSEATPVLGAAVVACEC